MQSCVQNIRTVRYLLDLYELTVTSLNVNVFRYVVVLFFGSFIMSTVNAV